MISQLCRLCATYTEPSHLVTEISELESKLILCCGWKPSEMEMQMPKKSCDRCAAELQRSWNLVERIRMGEEKLTKMLSENTATKQLDEQHLLDVKLEIDTEQADSFDMIEVNHMDNDNDDNDVDFDTPSDNNDDNYETNVFGEPVNYLDTIKPNSSLKSIKDEKEHKDPILSKLNAEDFLEDGSISCSGIERLTSIFPDMKTMSWNDCQYKCIRCNRILKGAQVLYAHVRSVHVDELMSMKLSCFYCNFKHRREYILNQHIAATHFAHLKFLCPYCPSYYWNARELINHRNLHTNLNYECEICGQICNNREAIYAHCLKQHAKRYQDGDFFDEYTCDKCNKQFKTKSGVRSHLMLHMKKFDSICDQCGKTFQSKGNLKEHLASRHSTERPHNCRICDKGFKTKHQLKNHSVIHDEVCKFVCTECGRKFRRTDSLSVHKRSHTNECPYKCKYCEKSFKHSITLQTHERAHTNTKPYKCTHCNYCATSKGNLNKHMMRAHSIDFRNHAVKQMN